VNGKGLRACGGTLGSVTLAFVTPARGSCPNARDPVHKHSLGSGFGTGHIARGFR